MGPGIPLLKETFSSVAASPVIAMNLVSPYTFSAIRILRPIAMENPRERGEAYYSTPLVIMAYESHERSSQT